MIHPRAGLTSCLSAVLWALAMLPSWATAGHAGQASFQRLEEVADRIKIVLRVKVLEVARSQDTMTLEGGKEGPVLRSHWDFRCEVVEVVLGPWTGENAKTATLRHTLSTGAVYDEQGKVTIVKSFLLPHSGMETELKAGDEFLACLESPGSPAERQSLYRAEPTAKRGAVLAAIAQAQAWTLFRAKHAELAKSVLLASFDEKTLRLALWIDEEGRPVYLVDAAAGTILQAKTHLVAPMNQLYFDESHVVLRFNDETPRPIRVNQFAAK